MVLLSEHHIEHSVAGLPVLPPHLLLPHLLLPHLLLPHLLPPHLLMSLAFDASRIFARSGQGE